MGDGNDQLGIGVWGGGLDIVRENMYKPRSCGDDEE